MPTALPIPTPEQRQRIAADFQRVNQWIGQGHLSAAVFVLALCCDLDPANLTYRRLLHSLWRRLHPPKSPLSLWDRLKRWIASRALRRTERSGDPARVLRAAERLLAIDPDNVSAYRAMATAFETAGLLANAVWCLEQAVAAGADPESSRNEWARLLERQGQFTRAAEVRGANQELVQERERLAGDLAARPGDFELAWALADLEAEYVRRDLAIAADKLRQHADDAELRAVHDRLAREAQTREIALWRQKADRYPGELSHHFQLGVRLLKAGQFEEALAAFDRAKADERLRWRSLVYAAYCHLNRGKWASAKALLEAALPLIPKEEPMRQQVVTMLEQGDSA